MHSLTLKLLIVGLSVCWLFAPLVVIIYRITVVPKRYREIVDRFIQNPATGQSSADTHSRHKSSGLRYARLSDPDCGDLADPEDPIKRQFYYFHGWSRYAFPLALVTALSGLMLAFSALWLADALNPKQTPQPNAPNLGPATNTPAATQPAQAENGQPNALKNPFAVTGLSTRVKPTFILALWGAFVWSLYEILSRRTTGDLSPVELYDVACRYATAIPIGYAFSLLALDTVPGFLAFAMSAFPLRDVQQLIRRQALQKLGQSTQASASLASQGYLSEVMSGMGNDTIARLQELNIETYLDLAYTDPIKLLIKTGQPIQLVLAWTDQALLAVYAAPHKDKLEQMGMPCALDLCEFYTRHCYDADAEKEKDWANDQAVKDLATALSTKDQALPPELLVHQLLRGVFEDPYSQFLLSVWGGPEKSQSPPPTKPNPS